MPARPDRSVDATSRSPLWMCPKCGHRFVTANTWHACSRYTIDQLLARTSPGVRSAFSRLVAAVERCGPVVVIAQKTRIVFMVRVRFAGCVVRKDHLMANIALPRRVDHPRWRSVDAVAPGWVAHRFLVRDGSELDDPDLAALICESYRLMGEQRRLARPLADSAGASSHRRGL